MRKFFTLIELLAYHGVARRAKCSINNFSSIFTLIELIVVISTITLLITLLLPALSKAKKMSQRIACCSQVKQATIGVITYLGDNNDKAMTGNNETGLINLLRASKIYGMGFMVDDYIDISLLYCPSRTSQINDYWKPEIKKAIASWKAGSIAHCDYAFAPGFILPRVYYWGIYYYPKNSTPSAYDFKRYKCNLPLLVDGIGNASRDTDSYERYSPHKGTGVNVGYLDGSARWIKRNDLGAYFTSGNLIWHPNSYSQSVFYAYVMMARNK